MNPRLRWPECCLAFGSGRTYRLGSRSTMPAEKAIGQKCGTVVAQIPPGQPNGWKTYAPSPITFAAADIPPVALDRDGLAAVRNAFAAAARRASRLGLDFIEILGGHGYLLHQFLSPLSNRREDEYGGSLENRMRFPLEVFEAVRAPFAHERPVTLRVSATDWMEGGWSIEETIAFVEALQSRGAAAINVSSGGSSPSAQIPVGTRLSASPGACSQAGDDAAGHRRRFDHRFRASRVDPQVGRCRSDRARSGLLYDPRWPWHALPLTLELKSERQNSLFAPNPVACGTCSFDFCPAAQM